MYVFMISLCVIKKLHKKLVVVIVSGQGMPNRVVGGGDCFSLCTINIS